jgi:hypothetical protein
MGPTHWGTARERNYLASKKFHKRTERGKKFREFQEQALAKLNDEFYSLNIMKFPAENANPWMTQAERIALDTLAAKFNYL